MNYMNRCIVWAAALQLSFAICGVAQPDNEGPDTEDTQVSAPVSAAQAKAAASYRAALELFRSGKQDQWERGRTLLTSAAEAEYPDAQNELGVCYLAGAFGFQKNAKKAVAQFKLATARGHAMAHFNLGVCHAHGKGAKEDYKRAIELLLVAVSPEANYATIDPANAPEASGAPETAPANVDRGVVKERTVASVVSMDLGTRVRANAHSLLGVLYAAQNNVAKAQEHDVLAAMSGEGGRAGVYPSAVRAAVRYAFGQGVTRDMAKANEMLEHSRRLSRRLGVNYAHSLVEQKLFDSFAQGDLEEQIAKHAEEVQTNVQFEIAGTFADPNSKDYNVQEAVKWYELAAEGKREWAMLSLAFIYAQGKLGAPDAEKAFHWFKEAAERGNHLLGYGNLAICYQLGYGVKSDGAKALEVAQAHRDQDIICYLVTVGSCPAGVVTYEQAVRLNEEWAKKDVHAQYLLAKRYFRGDLGVEAKPHKAISLLRKGAKAGHVLSMYELGLTYWQSPYSFKEPLALCRHYAFDYSLEAAKRGNARAAHTAGYFYTEGIGTDRNAEEAIRWYEESIRLDPKYAPPRNNLGLLYFEKWKTAHEKSDAAAVALYRQNTLEQYIRAHELGQEHASYNLGMLYHDGVYVKRDYDQAYLYFQAAAEKGHNTAHLMLGRMHESGWGVPVTPEEAAYHYRLAALDGNIEALRRLCRYYLSGKSGERDLDRAQIWLLALAHRGDLEAIMSIANLLIEKANYKDARMLLDQMQEVKTPALQYFVHERLAHLHANGLGVKQNAQKAAKYRKKAESVETPQVMHECALMLLRQGKQPEAVALLERAAPQWADAAYLLGCIHFAEDSGVKDEACAWKYFRMAAATGHTEACFNLAASTYNRMPGAPELTEAIEFAKVAEAKKFPRAEQVRRKLEERKARL